MFNVSKQCYRDCVKYIAGRGCKTLKKTYCRIEPDKECAWYKSKDDAEAEGITGRCGKCKHRSGRVCTVQEKTVVPYKLCDCGEFGKRGD